MNVFPNVPTFNLSELDGKKVELKYIESTDVDTTYKALFAVETTKENKRKAYLLVEYQTK